MANPMDCCFTDLQDKEEKAEIIRRALPACQPQEGSPANTFTHSELEELQAALPEGMQLGVRKSMETASQKTDFDICHQAWPSAAPQEGAPSPQDDDDYENDDVQQEPPPQDDYYGAPDFSLKKNVHMPRAFRESVRAGQFCGPTNAVCPGFLQCNLVVLPAGPIAFDFLLFCQRNPKSCPLIEVVEDGFSPDGIAEGADLRTDVPM